MRLVTRFPAWILGVSLTGIIVVVMLMYGDKDQPEGEVAPRTDSTEVTAGSDPPSLRKSKENLDRDVRAYVRAFMSKSPGMTQIDYIERIKTLESADHLGYFEQVIAMPVQKDLIRRQVTVKVTIMGEPEGELYGDEGERQFEGLVSLKLVTIERGVRSVLMPRTMYRLEMVEGPNRWQATYFSPRI